MMGNMLVGVMASAVALQLIFGASPTTRRGEWGRREWEFMRRDEQPGMYWGLIAFQCILAVVFFFYTRHN
jgi:hypothetical protein